VLKNSPKLLYLDLATKTGWAVGPVADRPTLGTLKLPSTGADLGEFGLYFEDWLCKIIDVENPDRIAFEAPFLAGGKALNVHTVRKLHGLCLVTELTCKRFDIRVSETAYAKVKTWCLGHGKRGNWKKEIMAAARSRGYHVEDDNQADAAMGWEYTASTLFPDLTDHLKSYADMMQGSLFEGPEA